jgi:chromosomal replication initiation ATPase DnaA
VVELLARQMERSFATVSRIVRRLDGLSLRSGRPVGVALARAVLRELAEAPDDGDDAGTRRP